MSSAVSQVGLTHLGERTTSANEVLILRLRLRNESTREVAYRSFTTRGDSPRKTRLAMEAGDFPAVTFADAWPPEDTIGLLAPGAVRVAIVCFAVPPPGDFTIELDGAALEQPGETLRWSGVWKGPTPELEAAPAATPAAAKIPAAAMPEPKRESPDTASAPTRSPETAEVESANPVADPPANSPAAWRNAGHRFKPRSWATADGKSTVEASFVSAANGKVKLRRVDNGKEVSIAIDRLTDGDRTYVEKQEFRADYLPVR